MGGYEERTWVKEIEGVYRKCHGNDYWREKNKMGRRMVDMMVFPRITPPMRSWKCVLDCKPMQYSNELIRERAKGTPFETANMTLRRGQPWDPTPNPYPNYLDQDRIHTNNFASHPIPLNSHSWLVSKLKGRHHEDSREILDDPTRPYWIQTMTNLPTKATYHGEFHNIRHDFYNNSQKGLWSNAKFNTPGAVHERPGYVGTYSNLHGNWTRFGPSTYDSIHGNGNWVFNWPIGSVERGTCRSLADTANINPRHDLVPIENIPQNMVRQCATGVIIRN
ncbi:hypothetical protein LSAT2_016851 [Lamellibrachia satsuma]|nr:hypothetical protein LSAT2_016851 [Lamellibrachia satsuma]